jgi:endonuclease YncB( thermonuclease family)
MEEVKGNAQIKNCRIIAVIIAALLGFPILLWAGQFKVTRVADGDTINVVGNGKKEIIRLVGIDAPEISRKKHKPGQPFSQKSTKYLASLVLNKMVDIKSYGQDRYGRILGVVYVNGMNVNLEMVKAGLAEVYGGRPAPGFDNDPYWEAEKEARQATRGMWVQGDKYISPREWRKMQREK